MNKVTETFIRHWWAGLKLIGKMFLFLIVLGIFSIPLNLFEELAEESQQGSTLKDVLVVLYWISAVILFPFLYGLVGRATYLISDESMGIKKEEKKELEVPCLNDQLEFDADLPPRKQ